MQRDGADSGQERPSSPKKAPDSGVITGLCGQPGQGPFYRITFRVEGKRFVGVGVETYGCPWANRIAGALKNILECVATGNAGKVAPQDLVHVLGGVPRNKRDLPPLAVAALKDALKKVPWLASTEARQD